RMKEGAERDVERVAHVRTVQPTPALAELFDHPAEPQLDQRVPNALRAESRPARELAHGERAVRLEQFAEHTNRTGRREQRVQREAQKASGMIGRPHAKLREVCAERRRFLRKY